MVKHPSSSLPRPSNQALRFLDLQTCGAAENMALDQALLESVDAGSGPVLRLYAWSDPTLSLGYFQRYADRSAHPESADVACLRRASGGGAILHDRELTYSIVYPILGMAAGANLDLYQRTHRAIARALSDFGIRAVPNGLNRGDARSFLCFQRRTEQDLIVSGYKVLGSAQRKGRRAVLQHGSLLVRASRWAPQLPGIFDLGSRSAEVPEIAQCVAQEIACGHGARLEPDTWTGRELERSVQIAENRFQSEFWLRRR